MSRDVKNNYRLFHTVGFHIVKFNIRVNITLAFASHFYFFRLFPLIIAAVTIFQPLDIKIFFISSSVIVSTLAVILLSSTKVPEDLTIAPD